MLNVISYNYYYDHFNIILFTHCVSSRFRYIKKVLIYLNFITGTVILLCINSNEYKIFYVFIVLTFL